MIIKIIDAVGSFFADNMPLYFFYGIIFLVASYKTYLESLKIVQKKWKRLIKCVAYIFLFTGISFITCYFGWARPEITSHAEMTSMEKMWIAISYIFDGITILPVLGLIQKTK